MQKPKLLVILGPTASGKSALAVKIAQRFSGEIISADSRQVYKGLNIGSGKITQKEMRGISHHLLDVVNPKKKFAVVDFQKKAFKAINEIHKRNKLPILCGGTGFYIQAIVDGVIFPEVRENSKLRSKLEKVSTNVLFDQLVKLDNDRAKTIDPHNRVRLIRAIEIAQALGSVPHIQKNEKFDTLQIGISTKDEMLKKKIKTRLNRRIKAGLIKEVQELHRKGLSWKRMNELGLEYRYVSLYLQKKIDQKSMVEQLSNEIWHYARRQKTWFKKDTRIKWFSLGDNKKILFEIKHFVN